MRERKSVWSFRTKEFGEMVVFEKKFLNFIERHLDVVSAVVITLLSMLIHISLRMVVSGDALLFLLPWYDEIRDGGGMKMLGQQVGNYNMLYQTLIALFTYLPVTSLTAYKLLSIFFDYCLAFTVGRLVYQYSDGNRKWKGIFAYAAVILSPIVIMNSSAWAQCDSIYVCFALLSLVMLCKEKYVPAFLLLGVSFSFKLQAMFVLPLFLFVYFWRKRFSILHFLIIPVVMCVLNMAGVIMGRSFLDIFSIYFKQTGEYSSMVLNYPSAWLFFTESESYMHYDLLAGAGIWFTAAVLLLIMVILILKKIEFSPRNLIYIAFLLSYTCVLFLPAMHERYGYLYEILAIVILIWKKETAVLIVPMYCLTCKTYAFFLFDIGDAVSAGAAAVNLAVYLGYLYLLLKEMTAVRGKAVSAACE